VASQQVLLIRHGETQWTLSGQHTGITDIALTENGRQVAARWRPLLSARSFELVLTSPLRRARETCELAGLKEQAQVDPDLMEWNCGRYEGITSQRIRSERPDWMIFRDGCPEGESPQQVGARVDRVIAKVLAVKGDVALFAHGHLLRVLGARWVGLDPIGGSHLMLDPATACVLAFYHGVRTIKRWNAPLMVAH
jgi:broad specificity phosphatase PhoE